MAQAPVDKSRVFGTVIVLEACEGLTRASDGVHGTYSETDRRIVYDPARDKAVRAIVHEHIHAYRRAAGLTVGSDDNEEERAVVLAESMVCDFVLNNPELAKWLLKGLLAEL